MEKTKVKKPGKVCWSSANRWGRAGEAPFNTVLGIPGAVFLFVGEPLRAIRYLYRMTSTDHRVPLGARVGKDFLGEITLVIKICRGGS